MSLQSLTVSYTEPTVPVAIMKAFLRHADGTTYTITAHLTKVLEKV